MNRRDLLRNTLLTIGGAAVNRPAQALVFAVGEDASAELARPGWKPIFLTAHQNETVIAMSDVIIPATDTPGAKAALVNRFLDLVLSAEPVATQHEFLASLAYLDAGALKRYKKAFVYLAPEEQNEYLTLHAYPHAQNPWRDTQENFSGREHFVLVKTWIASAFYSSPVGLKELGWDGSPPAGVFTGCEHPEETHTNGTT